MLDLINASVAHANLRRRAYTPAASPPPAGSISASLSSQQQLQSPTAKWPMAVHATYQFGDMPDYPFGKRQRFRDWGMWLVDDEEELITSSRYVLPSHQ